MSVEPVVVIGLPAEGMGDLPPALREAITGAQVLVGGKRHLALCDGSAAEKILITGDMEALAERIRHEAEGRRVVVLTSGDPLFFGFGKRLAEALGPGRVRLHPGLSCVQLLASRAGISWEDATLVSVHGREMAANLAPAVGRSKIFVLTTGGQTPRETACFLLERGYDDYTAWVGEDLGSTQEKLERFSLRNLAELEAPFSALNTMLLVREGTRGALAQSWRRRTPGIVDEEFVQRKPDKGLLTKREIRVAVLARLRLAGAGAADLWDLGAGSGSVAVEMALACPAARVLAFEKNEEECANIRANVEKFGTANVRLIEGKAPGTVPADSRPWAIFLGGSGGEIAEMVRLSWERLLAGGSLVATFATIENLAEALSAFKAAGAEPELAQHQIARGKPLLGMTRLDPLNPVFLVSATKPDPGDTLPNP